MDALGGDITLPREQSTPFSEKFLELTDIANMLSIRSPVHEHKLGVFVLGGSSAGRFHTTNKQNLDNMKALHMHGEVILCSEDVSTVCAVMNVGLS